MRKFIYTLLVIALVASDLAAQIRIVEIDAELLEKPVDSSLNDVVLPEDIPFLKDLKISELNGLELLGRAEFKHHPTEFSLYTNTGIYTCMPNEKAKKKQKTNPDCIIGSSFKVVDVSIEKSETGAVYCRLTLVRKESNETLTTLFLGIDETKGLRELQLSDFRYSKFDAFLYNASYLAKVKSLFKNKALAATESKTVKVLNDSSTHVVQKDDVWTCIDLLVCMENDISTVNLVLKRGSVVVLYPLDFKGDLVSEIRLKFKDLVAVEDEYKNNQHQLAVKQAIIDKYGDELAQKIMNKELALDMTTEMCLAAWGEPNDKHRTVSKTKTTEIWEYPHDRLIFEDDKLISIEQTSLLKVER